MGAPPPPRHEMIHAPPAARGVRVAFDPMFEQVLVARDGHADVMLAEQWLIARAQVRGLALERRAAVRPRGKRWVVKERDHQAVPGAIEALELGLDPQRALHA